MSISNYGLWLLVKDGKLTLLLNGFFFQLKNAIKKISKLDIIGVKSALFFSNKMVPFRLRAC